MKISYDPDSDTLSIVFQKAKYSKSKEADGIIVDYAKSGKMLSIEILNVRKRIPLKSISTVTPEKKGAVKYAPTKDIRRMKGRFPGVSSKDIREHGERF